MLWERKVEDGVHKKEVKQQSNSGPIKIVTNDKRYYKHDDFSMSNYKDIFDNLIFLLLISLGDHIMR